MLKPEGQPILHIVHSVRWDTSPMIDQLAEGGIDEVVSDGVVLILCGCSRERRKRCKQRRADRSGCEVPVMEDDLFRMAEEIHEVKEQNNAPVTSQGGDRSLADVSASASVDPLPLGRSASPTITPDLLQRKAEGEKEMSEVESALCKCGLRPPWHAVSCPEYAGLRIPAGVQAGTSKEPEGDHAGVLCHKRGTPEQYFEGRVNGVTHFSRDGKRWDRDLARIPLSDCPFYVAAVDDTATVENTFGPLDSYDLVEPTDEAVEACARLIHEVNAELCRFGNELVLEYTRDVRESVSAGIRRMIANPFETPEENHNAWMAYRAQEGWKLGRVKDPVAKTHPCMVPYDMLPPFQQLKDKMFQRIVRTFFGLPGPKS